MEIEKQKVKDFCNKERIIILVDASKKGEKFDGVEVTPEWLLRNSQY